VRIFSQTLNLLAADKVVNRHTAYMDSLDGNLRNQSSSHEFLGHCWLCTADGPAMWQRLFQAARSM
jgi:hypothetical protein